MSEQELAQLIEEHAIVGYSYFGKPIMSADFDNNVSIVIELEDKKMPVSMARPKSEGAEYIAKKFFEAINKKQW